MRVGLSEIMELDLEDFLLDKMQLSHVCQPVMLKVL